MMHPDTARAVWLAMQNNRRLPRTAAARAMDALAYVRNTQKEKASIAAGLKDFYSNERKNDSTLSASKNHPPR